MANVSKMIWMRNEFKSREVDLLAIDAILDECPKAALSRNDYIRLKAVAPALTNTDLAQYASLRRKIKNQEKAAQAGQAAEAAPQQLSITSEGNNRGTRYQAYLKTDHWQNMQRLALENAKNRCQVCFSNKSLNVHHRTYMRVGREQLSDLTVLCKSCHQLFHDNGKLFRAG